MRFRRCEHKLPVLVQGLCRVHEELLRGLEGDARVQGELQVSRGKVLEKSETTIRQDKHSPAVAEHKRSTERGLLAAWFIA